VVSRRKKIALIIGSVLALTIVIAVVGGQVLISRHDYALIRQSIATRINAATGFELEIKGPLELPYSLRPTVLFRDVALRNPEVGTGKNLLTAKDFRVTIELLPLLKGEIFIHDASLSAIDLNLVIDSDGRANWISDEVATSAPAQIEVHSIDFDDISLSYSNQETGFVFHSQIERLDVAATVGSDPVELHLLTEYRGMPLSLHGRLGSKEEILEGKAFPIDLSLDLHDVDIRVTGRVERVDEGDFGNIQLEFLAAGDNLRELEGLIDFSMPESDDFSLATKIIASDAEISASDVTADISWRDNHLSVRGNVQDLRNWSGLDLSASISGGDLSSIFPRHDTATFPRTDSYELMGHIRGDWPAVGVYKTEAHIKQGDVTLDFSGGVADLFAKTGVDVAVDLKGRDLAELSQFVDWTPPPTHTFQISGNLRGAWPTLSVSNASVNLTRDDLTMKLAGNIDDIASLTGIGLDVVAGGLDLSSVPELSTFDPPATDSFEFNGHLVGSASRLSLTGLDAILANGGHRVKLEGNIDEVAELEGMSLRFDAAGTDLSELNTILAMKFPPSEHYRASAAIAGDGPTLTASDVDIDATAQGVRLELYGDIGRIFELQDLDLGMSISIDDFSALSPYVGTDLPKSEPIELSGRLTGSAPDLNLEKFKSQSGGSEVKGTVGLRTGERLRIVGSVSSGVLDLRPYLSAARDEAEASEETASDRVFSDEPFDFKHLNLFDAEFTLDNLELASSAGNATVNQAVIKLEQGTLAIDPMELTRGESTISGHFRLDRPLQPEIDADLAIENVDLATFLQDIRVHEIYEGNFDMQLDLQSRGSSVKEVMANLNGEFAAFVSQARIPEVSLPLRKTGLILEMLPWVKRQEDVIVKCAIGELGVDDGIVDVKLLYMDSAQMVLVGGGTIDLRSEELDLRLSPRPKRSRILAHNIDIIVKGSLSEPDVTNVGAGKAVATSYGKYVVLGPLGLLVPSKKAERHPCFGSLQEYRDSQTAE